MQTLGLRPTTHVCGSQDVSGGRSSEKQILLPKPRATSEISLGRAPDHQNCIDRNFTPTRLLLACETTDGFDAL